MEGGGHRGDGVRHKLRWECKGRTGPEELDRVLLQPQGPQVRSYTALRCFLFGCPGASCTPHPATKAFPALSKSGV